MINKKFKQICCGALSAAMLAAAPMYAFAAETEILFSEDFEGQTVDSNVTGVYSSAQNEAWGKTDKTAPNDGTAVIKEDTVYGKYMQISTNTDGAKLFLNKGVGKEAGVVVIEYDASVKLNYNGYNGTKPLQAVLTNSSRDTAGDALTLFNKRGSDKGNWKAFTALFYNPETNKFVNTLIQKEGGGDLIRIDDTWQHYKIELDLSTGEMCIILDGEKSETWINEQIYKNVTNGSSLLDALIYRSQPCIVDGVEKNTFPWKIDNIKVYIPAPDPNKITVNTYDGKTEKYDLKSGSNTLKNPVSTMLDNMTVNFGSKVSDGVTASLKNNTTGAEEPVTLNVAGDGKTGTVTVDKKYIDANNSYTLTLSGTDASGNSFTTPTVINFTAGSDGGLAILSTEISPSDIGELKAGDTVTAEVKYVLTDTTQKKDNVILAITGEKASKLLYFGQTLADFDEVGLNTVTASFTVGGEKPDTLSAFVWDGGLRCPMTSFVKIPTE